MFFFTIRYPAIFFLPDNRIPDILKLPGYSNRIPDSGTTLLMIKTAHWDINYKFPRSHQ